MAQNPPSNPLRRSLALLLAAAAVLVPLLASLLMVLEAGDIRAGLPTRERHLSELDKRISAMRQTADTAPADGRGTALLYLEGRTSAIAGASLQEVIAGIVEGSGGRLIETDLLRRDDTADEPDRIDLRVTFDADHAALQQALHAAETGLPLLFVRQLDVRAPIARPEDAVSDPLLRVSLVVSAYWKGGTP